MWRKYEMKSQISQVLPEKFRQRHQLMLYLYDLLVDFLVKADKYRLSDVSFEFVSEGSIDFDLFDELSKQKDVVITEKIVVPHLFFSILRDLSHYLRESLSCAERGKVTVAFTLARKPLQDSIFYLSWLLVDSQGFVEKLQYEEPENYDVSKLKGKQDYVKTLFSSAIDIITKKKDLFGYSELIIDSDLLYDVLFNRKAPNSLTSAFDKSIHLVTNNRNYRTEKNNLNFIFADNKIWDDYWGLYYDKIPYVLLYIVEVVTSIFENTFEVDSDICEYNSLIRQLKTVYELGDEEHTKTIEPYFDILFDNESLVMWCDNCGNKFDFDVPLKNEIKSDYLFSCKKCGSLERVGQYFLDEEILLKVKSITIDNSNDNKWKLVES